MGDEDRFAEADDLEVALACAKGDESALTTLLSRHGRLIQGVIVRTVDERRTGMLEEVPACVDSVVHNLTKGSTLPDWNGRSTLRHFLAVLTRQVSTSYLQDVTPPGTLLSSLPSPSSLFLDEVLAEEPAKRALEVIERQPPNLGGVVRLSLRGMSCASIGATLGIATETVRGHLERVAKRLGELNEEAPEDAERAWRMLLDAADDAERLATAQRTLDDEAFRQRRSVVESTFRAVRARELDRLQQKTPECLDEVAIAAFVDGSLKGPERTRAEGHVATCPRCIDSVSQLAMDMRIVDALRDAMSRGDETAVAAACISTGRFRPGRILASAVAERGDEVAGVLARLATVGSALIGDRRGERDDEDEEPVEPSGVIPTSVPTDAEAPVVALEALAADDPQGASRAIDDELAHTALGARLRLLSAAAGDDPDKGRRIAEDLLEKSHSDPGLMGDARIAAAVPEGRTLPKEVLVERLRDTVPAVVRHVLTR